MMECAVLKRHRTTNEIMGVAGTVNNEGEVKEEDLVVEVDDRSTPTSAHDLGPQVVGGTGMVREVLYRICYFQSVDICELVYEHKRMHGMSALKSKSFVLSDQPYHVQCGS